jgi:CRISPR/Cas system-associated protein Cas7 (RAMP superfamily)
VGKPEGRGHFEDPEDGRIILRWIFRKWDVGVWTGSGWIGLAQERDRWRALVKAVMNLRVPYNAVNFLTS